MGLEEDVQLAAEWLAHADAIIVCIGDGAAASGGAAGAEAAGSGEPPRPEALAEAWEGLKERGLGLGELCDPQRFAEEPQLLWSFWQHCRDAYRDAPPHRGQALVASIVGQAPCGAFLEAMSPRGDWANVGWPADRLLERRGPLSGAMCMAEACGGHCFPAPSELDLSQLPRCPRCGAVARPALNVTAWDPGCSSEFMNWQFGNLSGWLGRLTEESAALRYFSVVVLDVDFGPSTSDLWHLVSGHEGFRLVGAGSPAPDVSAWGGRAVGLPISGLEALERLDKAGRELKRATFVCKDAEGNGAEVLAPMDAQLGHVLRRSALGASPPGQLRCSALHVQRESRPEEAKLEEPVPQKLFFKMKDDEPPLVRIDVHSACYGGQNEPLKQRLKAVRSLLEDLIFFFDTPMYQKRLALAGDKVAVRDLIREIHSAVLPRHGFAVDREGLSDVQRARVAVQMQAFLHSGMTVLQDIHDLGDILQETSGFNRMRFLPMPAPPPGEPKPTPAPAAPSAVQGNPLDANEYHVPPMTPAQAKLLTVPFKDVKRRLLATLEEHGAAIVTGVVGSQAELTELEEEFAKDLHDLIDTQAVLAASKAVRAALQGVSEKGPRAFPVRTAEKWLTASAGFGLHRCLCHGRFAWAVRRHPRVQAVFRALFPKAGALVSSMDVTFFSPEGQPAAESNGFSAHVDQNLHDVRPGLAKSEVYQGVLYVWPSGEEGDCSTTVVWPGSHKEIWRSMMQDKAFRLTGARGYHYSEIRAMTDRERARSLAQQWAQSARRAVVPAGGMLLWSSRTVHAGWKGGPRLAQAVCLEPAERRSEAERMSKLRLAALGLASAHWAAVGMQHDMCIGSPGCLESRSTMADDDGSGDPSRVLLPLRQALKPTGLAAGADRDALWDLVTVQYRHTGMWAPKKDYVELLETSVLADVKKYL